VLYFTHRPGSQESSHGFWLLALPGPPEEGLHRCSSPRLSNPSSEVSYAQITLPEVTRMPLGDTPDSKHGETHQLSLPTLVSLQGLQKTSDKPSVLQQTGEESLCLPPQRLQILVPKSKQNFFITKHRGLCEFRRFTCLLLLLSNTGLLTSSSPSFSF